jgi:predicted transcriptional regulator
MRTVSFKLPESLDDALTALARARGLSRSAIVREALEFALKARGRSVTALACDLVGAVERPADPGGDPEHLSGYGT